MITYRDAGVDVTAGYEAVRLMREHVQRTFDGHVLTDIGSFGGVYDLHRRGLRVLLFVWHWDGRRNPVSLYDGSVALCVPHFNHEQLCR